MDIVRHWLNSNSSTGAWHPMLAACAVFLVFQHVEREGCFWGGSWRLVAKRRLRRIPSFPLPARTRQRLPRRIARQVHGARNHQRP